MTDTSAQWVERITRILAEKGYALGVSPIAGALLATKRVNSLGPFLPTTDFVFIHDFSAEGFSASLEELHEEAIAWADARFRLPRPLRYHIPNAVSVGVSDTGFSDETIGFATRNKLRSPLVGGAKDSTYLFDVAEKRLYSAGPEATPGRYGSQNVTSVNPSNRMLNLMNDLLRELRKR
jgi:hypothetical protein